MHQFKMIFILHKKLIIIITKNNESGDVKVLMQIRSEAKLNNNKAYYKIILNILHLSIYFFVNGHTHIIKNIN